jgi:hypothetical protein
VADRPRGWRPPSALLWGAAVVLTLAAAVFQRLTGPTHPLRGATTVDGQTVTWRLPRSGNSGEPLRVEVPAPPSVESATLRWRRYPSDEEFQGFSMLRDDDTMVGLIPSQPPAGKVEYYIAFATRSGLVRLPGAGPTVMRFKGAVPATILVPHIALMFIAMLLGLRAGLEALVAGPRTRPLARWTFIGITLGGMLMGPIVQKFAFDAFWTGWPFGGDLTDNKTLVAWVAWLVAVLVVRSAKSPRDRFARTAVLLATVITFAVFMVPHSLGGSELDYQKLDAGVSPKDAVRTGS